MRMRAARVAAVLWLVPLAEAAIPKPADWVPARWPWSDPKSLQLLQDSPVNCLLLASPPPEFVAAAKERGIVVLAISGDADDTVLTADGLPTIHLTARARMKLGSSDPIIGTTQGVWPGISEKGDEHKAGPTSGVWIDTNTGFLRAARAWGASTVWIANEPPPKTVITTARYLQVIADAA